MTEIYILSISALILAFVAGWMIKTLGGHKSDSDTDCRN